MCRLLLLLALLLLLLALLLLLLPQGLSLFAQIAAIDPFISSSSSARSPRKVAAGAAATIIRPLPVVGVGAGLSGSCHLLLLLLLLKLLMMLLHDSLLRCCCCCCCCCLLLLLLELLGSNSPGIGASRVLPAEIESKSKASHYMCDFPQFRNSSKRDS